MHYRLPPGKVQIAFSGGRTSAYMLRKIMDANPGMIGNPDVQVTFQNTGREMPVCRGAMLPFSGVSKTSTCNCRMSAATAG